MRKQAEGPTAPTRRETSAAPNGVSELCTRSRSTRLASVDGVRSLRAAVGDLRKTVQTFRSTETSLARLLLNARSLVFRRVVARDFEHGGGLRNQFYGADADMIGPTQDGVAHLDQSAWYRRIHPDDLAAYRAAEAARWSSGTPFTMEYRILHSVTGELHWVRETAWTERDPGSRETTLDSHLADVTQQKRAEASLRASEERYRALVEEQEACICCCASDHVITFVSEGLCRRLGRPREALLGAHLSAAMSSGTAAACLDRLASLSRALPAVTYEAAVVDPDGGMRWEEWTGRALFDDSGQVVEYHLVGRDVTERKHAEQRLLHLAYHDPVTDLPNRRLFDDRLRQALAQASRGPSHVALLMLDVDEFKRINDSQGHQFGDQVLMTVGRRLRGLVREGDTVARLGGDEFAVLLTALHDRRAATARAQKIARVLAGPLAIGAHEVSTRVSIGVAVFPEDGDDAETLSRSADTALYRAKREGRSRCRLHRTASR